MKASDAALAALFLISAFAMYLAGGKYPFVYAAGAAALALAVLLRVPLVAQVSGFAMLLVFTSTANPTLPGVLMAVGILSVYVYGGHALGRTPWKRAENGFEITERKSVALAYSAEVGRVVVPAALLSIVTAVLAGGLGVKADSLLIFIFMVSLGLLLLGLISRHMSGQ